MNIVAYGGGTNSTAMLIECVRREIPVDLILFADTGGERPNTYAYVKTFSEWLVGKGYPAIVTVTGCYPKQIADGSLENECLRLKVLPSRAYGYGSCSMKWKRDPQDRYVSTHPMAVSEWGKGNKVMKFIGMDADEDNRSERILAIEEKKYAYRCPLVEWEMAREECIETIKEAGLCLPGKSACFYCPSSRPSEIRQLGVVYPELAQRALDMEEAAAAGNTKIKGLGRSYSWKEILDQKEMFEDDFHNTPEMACGCYDG